MSGKTRYVQFDRKRIEYSDRYYDEKYEYRHVILPYETDNERQCVKYLNSLNRFLSEGEWRMIGLEMSSQWEHYGYFAGEPNVLLFRRFPSDL